MFRTKTVIVIGAGASCEVGFPSGKALLEQIASALDIRSSDGLRYDTGDRKILAAMESLSREGGGSLNEYIRAGWRVRDAAILGISIDNVINQFSDDPLVAMVGKLAIGRMIIAAERECRLMHTDAAEDMVSILRAIRDSWFGGFAQLLVQDKTRIDVPDIFENIAVISFNYDRSVRHFLPMILMSQFGLDEPVAQKLAASLRIIHPYGSIGTLPWEHAGSAVPFGAESADLIRISASLRTFTEQVHDEKILSEIQRVVSESEHLVFLGFGYHRQNIELLRHDVEGNGRLIFGTVDGVPSPDVQILQKELGSFLNPAFARGSQNVRLLGTKCGHFVSQYFWSLTM